MKRGRVSSREPGRGQNGVSWVHQGELWSFVLDHRFQGCPPTHIIRSFVHQSYVVGLRICVFVAEYGCICHTLKRKFYSTKSCHYTNPFLLPGLKRQSPPTKPPPCRAVPCRCLRLLCGIARIRFTCRSQSDLRRDVDEAEGPRSKGVTAAYETESPERHRSTRSLEFKFLESCLVHFVWESSYCKLLPRSSVQWSRVYPNLRFST